MNYYQKELNTNFSKTVEDNHLGKYIFLIKYSRTTKKFYTDHNATVRVK